MAAYSEDIHRIDAIEKAVAAGIALPPCDLRWVIFLARMAIAKGKLDARAAARDAAEKHLENVKSMGSNVIE